MITIQENNNDMLLKYIYKSVNVSLYVFFGISLLDFLALTGISHLHRILPSIDSVIVTVMAFSGLLLFWLKIYFFWHKSNGERKLQNEQIQDLHIKNKLAEINANKIENEVYAFRSIINGMSKEDFDESESRMKP